MSGTTAVLSPLQQQAMAAQQQQFALAQLPQQQQLNLLGIPQGIQPSQQAFGNAGLGDLYNAVANYARIGNAGAIQHPLLGAAVQSAFPSWSPLYQLAQLQLPQTQGADAAAIQQALAPPAPVAPVQTYREAPGNEGGR